MNSDKLILGGKEFNSRLFTGTGKFGSHEIITPMLEASQSEMITVALRRVNLTNPGENILNFIPKTVSLLPNTSGARTAEEAVRLARIARAAGCGDFIKIEVINEQHYLLPDNLETLKATEILAKEGFIVLPYVFPDLPLAYKLENAGAAAIMPLGSPIGSGQGLQTRDMIRILIENCKLPVIVDAGIGAPSQACEAMEMGAAAVLVNSAIACAAKPVIMGRAFKLAVEAGRSAYLSGMMLTDNKANASSPLTGFLFS